MAKKKRDRKIQKNIQINDASVASPPYETNSYKSNTKLSMKDNHNKKEHIDSNICLCKSTYQPKTWQSITGMYGDQETTKIWDNNNQKSITLYKPLQKVKNNYMKEKQPDGIKNSISQSKYNKNKKYAKKSKGLYRKHKNIINSLKTQENHIDDEIVKDKTPAIQFKLPKKPKLKRGTLMYHEGTGDSCVDGPCTIDSNCIPQKVKNSVDVKTNVDKGKMKTNKLIKESKDDKSKSIKGYGDHASPVTLEKSNGKTNKGSFLNKIKKITSIHKNNNKQSNKSTEKSREPLFVMKVDSKEMRILNPLELNTNVKKFGISKKHQCICPSRLKISNNVCDNGICKRALTNNHVRFSCKCAKNNIIECKDTTCDSKKRLKHVKNEKKSSKYVDQNNPLFQIMLDPNMSILNSYEVHDIFNKADKEICPTGICSVAAKNRSTELNCKCVSKKIKPEITECTNRTCQPEKKCKISYLCSRIFSKSDNLGHPKRITTNRHVRRPPFKKKKEKLTVQSDAYHKRDGVSINVSREPKRARDDQKDLWCKCFCECSKQTAKIKRKKYLQPKKKEVQRKRSRKSKNKLRKCSLKRKLRRKQIEPLTLKEYLEECLRKKRVRCEKKIKEKEKEFKKNEKKLKKQLLKEKKEREKTMKLDAHNWNCLTNLVNGVLNLVTESIKNIFSAISSILTNPFGSFVYFKQRALDPPGTMQKIGNWIKMTWTNKSTKISQSVKESQNMNIIADHFEDSVLYDKLFANKGRTTKERQAYEKKKRMRKRRIQKRHDEALYGCRHMLLTTMRKTPHLWFYHICPDLYPQCLSLVTFMRNFFHLLIFLLAFLCWTPCIVSFEICRAFLCCFLCTH